MSTTHQAFLSRAERFASVGSTNDVVRAWLDDAVPEVCLAVADEQTAGRGREGRRWEAPPGAALLLSLGFRPAWLPADRVWRLPAIVSLAMADAAEEVAGLPDGSIRLKWPNDLVIEATGPRAVLSGAIQEADAATRLGAPVRLRKVAGVLGESDGLGTDDPRVVVGIGTNADWPEDAFPPAIADSMTSLRAASGGRPIDLALLLDAFTNRVEARTEALRAGYFDVAGWVDRQATTGRMVRVERPDGVVERRALGVDALTGGLILDDDAGGEQLLHAGDVTHVRLAGQV